MVLFCTAPNMISLTEQQVVKQLNGAGQCSLFAYDNDTFAIYKYTDKRTGGGYGITVDGNADSIVSLTNGMTILPSAKGPMGGMFSTPGSDTTVFNLMMTQPGDLNFYKINWSEQRHSPKPEFRAGSAPNDFVDD